VQTVVVIMMTIFTKAEKARIQKKNHDLWINPVLIVQREELQRAKAEEIV
jgi:hypothetical protein